MSNTVVKVNMRQRILACVNLNDFLSENSHFESTVKDRKIVESIGICEQIGTWFDRASSVREKLQILTFCRKWHCSIPAINSGELFGIVIEFGNEFAVDTLAVYSDRQGAWYNGRDKILTEAELSIASEEVYQQLCEAVCRGMQQCRPHPTEIPSPPPPGYIVINFLSEKGIAYALGASRDMASDGICGPIIYSALVIQKMILGM